MKNRFGPKSKSVNFADSITICLNKYFVFEGRASRSEFWPYFFIYTLGPLILNVSLEDNQMTIVKTIATIFTLVGFLPMISVGCRRMHDIDKSGWWQNIPFYNLFLWAQDSSEGTTQTRPSRSTDLSDPSQNVSSKNDLIDELEELQILYEDGTLSEAQFKKAKKKLLK